MAQKMTPNGLEVGLFIDKPKSAPQKPVEKKNQTSAKLHQLQQSAKRNNAREERGLTEAEKLAQVKSLLNITGADSDTQLEVFLTFAKAEILSWMYGGKTPDSVTDVPVRYEPTQVMAVVTGYSMQGAEGQLSHNEGGISRTWKHEDAVAYIRSRVIPYIGVM